MRAGTNKQNRIEIDREFRARRLHPYLLFAAPFGICLLVLTGIGVLAARSSWSYLLVALFSFTFGAAVIQSCAFNVWGRLRIIRAEGKVIVTRSLARWSRSREFYASQVQSISRTTSTPNAIVWPGIAGRHLSIVIARQDRPISIGEGLNLDDDELNAIEGILCAPT